MFKKIFLNTIAQIFSKAGTAIISIFLLSVLTNYLTQELFGIYSKVYNYLGIFAFLADLGLYTITIREITNNREESGRIVSNVMTLRTILGIIIILVALSLAFFLPGYNDKINLISIFIVSIFTLVSLINSSILALMQSNLKMEFSLFSNILGKLITFLGILVIVFVFYKKENILNFELPFYFIFISGLIGITLTTGLNYFYAKKITKFGFSFDKKYILHIFKISIPYGLALFLSVLYFKIDVIIISLLEPKYKSDISIALYSLPMKIVEVLMTLGAFYLNSILGELSTYFKNKEQNYKKILNMFSISFKVLLSFSLFLLVMGSIFKNHIIEIISNKSYINPLNHEYSSSGVFSIVLLVLVFYFISNLFIYILISSKNEKKLLTINTKVALFNVIGNILIIPFFSFIGAAIITVFSQLLLLFISSFEVRKIIKFKIPIRFIFINIVFSLIIYFFGEFMINNYKIGLISDLLIYSFIFGIFYLIFFYFLYKINKNNNSI